MKESLKPGLIASKRVDIDLPRTIDFLGEELRIYATPELVRDIEWTCRDFLLAHADEGEDSVGIGMDIRHSGATPLDAWVEIDLGRTVVARRIRVRFAESGDPFLMFRVLVADGTESFGRQRSLRFHRAGQVAVPNKDQREFVFDLAPRRPVPAA